MVNTRWTFSLFLTFASAFVWLQLHEVRTSAGEGLVEVDETEVGTRAAAVHLGTRVWSWREEKGSDG